jgi:glucose-6-phosphate 1-dehydrogenase
MTTQSNAIVILGASGDLAQRKLIPALNVIFPSCGGPDSCVVIGCGRTDFTNEEFIARFDVSPQFRPRLFYHRGISGLKKFIDSKGAFNRIIFFLALPPAVYASTASDLAAEGFLQNVSIIIEKPFGYDFKSAEKLDEELTRYFFEEQIFRIDHYLAKEAVQNMLVFRFANALFEPVWNSRYIESLQINAFETIGIGERGAYFDRSGIIRDMVQNHLMQLLCLLTMEPPQTLNSEDIRARKIDVLEKVKVEACCRMQYEGYKKEKGVSPDSTTETYAMLQLSINNDRWSGVPVYIRVGKALSRKGTEIGVRLRPVPTTLFNVNGDIPQNKVVFKIQPAEGIIVDMAGKIPGSGINITGTKMAFCYRDSFSELIPEAYQRLLLDAVRGDRTLFVSSKETGLSWKLLEPVLDKGEPGIYYNGIDPSPCWGVEWIDFESYSGICS